MKPGFLFLLFAQTAMLFTHTASAQTRVLARFPNSDGTHLVFSARGHLWTTNLGGEHPQQLTGGNGYETSPHYSPDGRWIAFTAMQDGEQDVYVVPSQGGEPRRLTRLGPSNAGGHEGWVIGWTPNSKHIVFLSQRHTWNTWQYRPFAVPLNGGEPQQLPVNISGYLSFGPDGHSMALNRIFSDFRNWKRYAGGLKQDIDIYDPATRRLQTVVQSEGNNSDPMWIDQRIYFLSDRDSHHRVNLWYLDLRTGHVTQVTKFTDYDADVPSYGGGVISFQQGGKLWTLDVRTGHLQSVAVMLSDDGSRTSVRTVSVKDTVRKRDTDYDTDYDLSPGGEAALIAARGDIFLVRTQGSASRNLTATSNADEDHPAWSPDGRLIAYTSDASGEQQLVVRPAVGGKERQLTHFSSGFLFQPRWSPDGRYIAIHDGAHRLWLVPTDGSKPRQIAYNRFHYMHETDEHDVAFSPDSQWMAFSTSRPTRIRALHLYHIPDSRDVVVSSSYDSDYRPAFSPDGKYLYFVSDRNVISVQSDRETNAVTVKSGGIYVAALAADTPARFSRENDKLAPESDSKTENEAHGATSNDACVSPPNASSQAIRVDVDGITSRAIPVPIEPGKIVAMQIRNKYLFYRTQPPDTLGGDFPGETSVLHRFDLDQMRNTTVAKDIDDDVVSADGCHVLEVSGNTWTMLNVSLPVSSENLDLSALKATIDPKAEWREMFDDVWRMERDLFVNANMNGVDWKAIHDSYARLLPLAGTRDDVNYLMGQMLGELGSSHEYVGGGDYAIRKSDRTLPKLGADIELDTASGRYRISRIFKGDCSRSDACGPLGWPGLDVREGDYLLAIDKQELRAPTTPEDLMAGTHGSLELILAATPEGARRLVNVMPVSDDQNLREMAVVEHNRAMVDHLSGGRIGYIHMSDMLNDGMSEFIRSFYPQLDKQALIIDDRWNPGGNLDQVVLERLRRTLSSVQTMRDRVVQTQPDQVLIGPKVMLINHFSASDGDMFPYHFRAYGLGKLIGTRTWGGVRGLRTRWTLLDGGAITIPEITFVGLDGKWTLENRGNVPDIEVEEQPWEEGEGEDRQLDAAIQYLLKQLPNRKAPPAIPADDSIYAPAAIDPCRDIDNCTR